MSHGNALESCHAILCFGDSLTGGYSPATGCFSPYCDRLVEHLHSCGSQGAVVNSSIAGESTDMMLQRLNERLKKGPPESSGAEKFDFVLILGGTNDLTQFPHDCEAIFRNLLALHQMVHRIGAKSGVITVPRICTNKRQEECDTDRIWVNSQLRDFAARNQDRTIFVDLEAAAPQDGYHSKYWDPDGLHLSREGYQAFGDLVFASASLEPKTPRTRRWASLKEAPVDHCRKPLELATTSQSDTSVCDTAKDTSIDFAASSLVDINYEIYPLESDVSSVGLLVQWALPVGIRNAKISYVHVEVRRENIEGSVVGDSIVPFRSAGVRFSPLSRNSSYCISVVTVGESGQGSRRSAILVVPGILVGPRKYSLPSDCKAKQFVKLRWQVSCDVADTLGYRIWYRPSNAQSWNLLVEDTKCSDPSLTCTVPYGCKYDFKVAAITVDGLQNSCLVEGSVVNIER